MDRLRHPEYDDKLAELNMMSAEFLLECDDQMMRHLKRSILGRIARRRFDELCGEKW